jgi:hypothetical protein
MDENDFSLRGCARGFMAAKRARESPMSHVLVAKATVANVMVPKIIDVAIVDTGASEAADIRASIV